MVIAIGGGFPKSRVGLAWTGLIQVGLRLDRQTHFRNWHLGSRQAKPAAGVSV